jgi:hypothetical protein
VLDQICTSFAPSRVPPNHAAMSFPGSCSTIVDAWQEGKGAFSKIIMADTLPGEVPKKIREKITD